MARVRFGACVCLLLLGAGVVVSPARAAEPDAAPQPKCKRAEINPVTGHVLCIDPLGAAVEAPPEDIAPPCNADQSRGQWTWAPTCDPKIEGM